MIMVKTSLIFQVYIFVVCWTAQYADGKYERGCADPNAGGVWGKLLEDGCEGEVGQHCFI